MHKYIGACDGTARLWYHTWRVYDMGIDQLLGVTCTVLDSTQTRILRIHTDTYAAYAALTSETAT